MSLIKKKIKNVVKLQIKKINVSVKDSRRVWKIKNVNIMVGI